MFHRRGRGWPGSRDFLGGHGLSRMCVEVVPGCDACGRRQGLAGLRDEAPSGRLPTGNGLAQLGGGCGGARPAGPGCGACGRRQGLAGLRDRSLRAKLVCGDLAGGPPPTGATGRIKWAGLAPPGSVVAKMSRGSEVAKVPSEARGADGERAGRSRATWKCGGGGAARERGRQEFSVRRRRSRRGRLRNRSRMGRCGPSGSRGRSRRFRRLRRCRGRGRG